MARKGQSDPPTISLSCLPMVRRGQLIGVKNAVRFGHWNSYLVGAGAVALRSTRLNRFFRSPRPYGSLGCSPEVAGITFSIRFMSSSKRSVILRSAAISRRRDRFISLCGSSACAPGGFTRKNRRCETAGIPNYYAGARFLDAENQSVGLRSQA